MKTTAILEDEFHHDGKGPSLERAIWSHGGIILKGFEYYNPEDANLEEKIKNIALIGLEAFSMAVEDVHGNNLITEDSADAIFKIDDSPWLKQFNPAHMDGCSHYQLVFCSEIYDVICRDVKAGSGRLLNDEMQVVKSD